MRRLLPILSFVPPVALALTLSAGSSIADITTIFWISEQPSENKPVPNHASSWESQWQLNFGGYDNPT
jgi:hypothetical protein